MSMADPLFVTEKQPLEDAKELNAQGLLLSTGCGVPQDHYLALIHFKKAAQLGNIDALYNLAVAYEYGLGSGCRSSTSDEVPLESGTAGKSSA